MGRVHFSIQSNSSSRARELLPSFQTISVLAAYACQEWNTASRATRSHPQPSFCSQSSSFHYSVWLFWTVALWSHLSTEIPNRKGPRHAAGTSHPMTAYHKHKGNLLKNESRENTKTLRYSHMFSKQCKAWGITLLLPSIFFLFVSLNNFKSYLEFSIYSLLLWFPDQLYVANRTD